MHRNKSTDRQIKTTVVLTFPFFLINLLHQGSAKSGPRGHYPAQNTWHTYGPRLRCLARGPTPDLRRLRWCLVIMPMGNNIHDRLDRADPIITMCGLCYCVSYCSGNKHDSQWSVRHTSSERVCIFLSLFPRLLRSMIHYWAYFWTWLDLTSHKKLIFRHNLGFSAHNLYSFFGFLRSQFGRKFLFFLFWLLEVTICFLVFFILVVRGHNLAKKIFFYFLRSIFGEIMVYQGHNLAKYWY